MAAVVLHLIAPIPALLPGGDTSRLGLSEAIPVNLVFALEAAPSAQPEAYAAAAAAATSDDTAPAFHAPEVQNTTDSSKTIANSEETPSLSVTKERQKFPGAASKNGRKKQQGPGFDVAVYDVLVDAVGNVRDVVLMRSSGVRSFDEAGKKMIYDGIALPPRSHEGSALRVTLRFSREPR